MKKLLFAFIIYHSALTIGAAQNNTDSLRVYWNDTRHPDSLRAHALDRIAISFSAVNNDSAWSAYSRLLAFAEDNNMPFFKAKALNGFSLTKSHEGDHHAAIKYGNEALQLFSEIKDNKGIAGCYINMAGSFYMLGHVNLSIKYVIKGTKICEKYKFMDYLSNGYSFIGYMYYAQKNFADALKYMLKTDSLDTYLGRDDIFGMKTNLGIAYHELGMYDKSIAALKSSLEVQIELNQKANLSNTLMELGNVYGKTGDFDLAIKYIDEAIVVAKENNQMTEMSNAMLIKGQVYIKMNEYNKAIIWCSEAGKVLNDNLRLTDEEVMCDCLFQGYKGANQGAKALVYLERMNEIKDTLTKSENAKLLQQAEFATQMMADSIAQAETDRLVLEAHKEEMRQEEKTRNIAIGTGGFLLLLAGGLYTRVRYIRKSKATLQVEKDRSENLLLNILPEEIAQELKIYGKAEARDFDLVSILFTDFKGFTQASANLSAQDLVSEINTCFEVFDSIIGKYNIEKIKTIGDAYMAAGGLPVPTDDSVKNTVLAALEMQDFIVKRKSEFDAQVLSPSGGGLGEAKEARFEMRVGIHTGPVVAGIVGVKKFQYDIWGDTVNTASRIESNGEAGKVNISQATYELLKDDNDFAFESRGKIEAKGKGEMEMYFVTKS